MYWKEEAAPTRLPGVCLGVAAAQQIDDYRDLIQ